MTILHKKQYSNKHFTAMLNSTYSFRLSLLNMFQRCVCRFSKSLCTGSNYSFVQTIFVLLYVQVREAVAVERTKEHCASSPLKSPGKFTKSKISRHKRNLFSLSSLPSHQHPSCQEMPISSDFIPVLINFFHLCTCVSQPQAFH